MDEKIRGGKRLGAGRKPVGNKKKPITIYVETNKIYPFGNEEKLKAKLHDFIDGGIQPKSIQDLTKPTNEIKPFEHPKTNYQVKVEPKPEMIPMGSFGALKAKILKTETVKQIDMVMKEIKAALLNGRQKLMLEQVAKEHSKDFYNE